MGSRFVAVDASVLINFIHVGRLDLLAELPGYECLVPDHAAEEVTRPSQRAALRKFLESGRLHPVCITDPGEMREFADLRTRLGDGEAACLALAQSRGWLVACDEKRAFLREADQRIGRGRVLNTPSLLVLAILAGCITVEEADRFKAILETRRFRIRARSFRDLLPPASESPER